MPGALYGLWQRLAGALDRVGATALKPDAGEGGSPLARRVAGGPGQRHRIHLGGERVPLPGVVPEPVEE